MGLASSTARRLFVAAALLSLGLAAPAAASVKLGLPHLGVIPTGRPPRPAGLFSGSTTVRLRGIVPRNAVVAVTVERAGGARAPTTTPILTARA